MGRVARVAEQDADHIGGRYRLVEQLGTGGMSVVWRGYDEILGRQVAVKVLSPRLATDEVFRQRLRLEALAAAQLCHPNITSVFDFGESGLGGTVVPYVVMELNDGESVSRRLARSGPLPWQEAVTVTVEVASALATAHAGGVVHRDVTPANVMLTGAGAKVVDFGISALIGDRDAAEDGSLLGTPAYLAPERLGGGHVLPASDVYALGLLLYRALTARLPWPAQTTTEALRAHLYADPEPIPTLPGMPPAVVDLCLRCLVKDPTGRPAAAEVARALVAVVGSHVVLPPLPAAPPAQGRRPDLSACGPDVPALGPDLPELRPDLSARGPDLSAPARPAVGAGLPLAAGTVVPGSVGRRSRRAGRIGWALPVVRHRVQAAALTVALLTMIGMGWASTDEPTETGPAQAAAVDTGAVPAGPRATNCRVRYQVRRDSGDMFDAALTVTNTGRHVVTGWEVQFAYPGHQRLVGLGRTVAQRGRRVVVQAGDLRPGRSVEVALRGSYRRLNVLPLAFSVDGHPCRTEVIGTVVPDSAPAREVGTGEAGRSVRSTPPGRRTESVRRGAAGSADRSDVRRAGDRSSTDAERPARPPKRNRTPDVPRRDDAALQTAPDRLGTTSV